MRPPGLDRRTPSADACALAAAWLIGLPRRAGRRLFAINDAEARWRGWQVTETLGGLGRQYRDARFDALAADPALRRDDLRPDRPARRPSTAGRVHAGRRRVMASGRPQGRNDPSLISSLETACGRCAVPDRSSWPGTGAVELAILAAIAACPSLIAGSIGLIGLAAVSGAGLAAGAALLCWPPARQQIVAWAWCVITPHRVRAGCVNAWVQTRSGRLPIIWSASADRLRRAGSAVAARPASPPPT